MKSQRAVKHLLKRLEYYVFIALQTIYVKYCEIINNQYRLMTTEGVCGVGDSIRSLLSYFFIYIKKETS